MKESEIIEKYGEHIWNAMQDSVYLDGITIRIVDGEIDIPSSDLELAYKHIQGKPIYSWEWD